MMKSGVSGLLICFFIGAFFEEDFWVMNLLISEPTVRKCTCNTYGSNSIQPIGILNNSQFGGKVTLFIKAFCERDMLNDMFDLFYYRGRNLHFRQKISGCFRPYIFVSCMEFVIGNIM